MSYFEVKDGHIVAEENGRIALDTRAPMFCLVPSATILKTGYAISFPDLWKGTIYHQSRQAVTIGGTVIGENFGCGTWVGLVGQEWGPEYAAPHNLPDIEMGTVPDGTDYLEIWVKLTRTVNPANMLDLALASNFPEGQWVKLDGYSCVVEEFMGVARQFEFVLDGTTVKLRRRQSVNDNGGNVSPPVQRVTGGAILGNKVFFFPGTNAPEAAGRYAVYGEQIDRKGPSRDGPAHRPAGYEVDLTQNVPCSTSHAGKSYASVWTGDIRIIPGCIGA